MYGVFGGYTRWAVVFLIIFVLFFLLVPVGMAAGTGTGVAVTSYHHHHGGYMGGVYGHGYEGESS